MTTGGLDTQGNGPGSATKGIASINGRPAASSVDFAPMTTESPQSTPRRHRSPTFVLIVAAVVACWILGNPRSSGPDEPSHMVASAGFVRGQGTGDPNPNDPATRLMDVPAMVGAPDPGCWAFVQEAVASCANDITWSDDDVELTTTSYNYPPWALLLPGLASFVPWAEGYAYLARTLSALVPIVLIGSSLELLTRRRRVLGAAALLGLTPIAWFTFGIVNPSAMSIAGGLALWSALLIPRFADRGDLLALAGWIALVLARRDGPLWASLIVILSCILTGTRPIDIWRSLRPLHRTVAAVAAVIPLVSVLARGDTAFNVTLAAATLSIPAYEFAVRTWTRHTDPTERSVMAAGGALAGILAVATVLLARPGGFDADVVRLVVGNTGDHLFQLVGVLGWLSAPVPLSGVLLFWAAVGGLAAVAVLERPSSAIALGIGLATAIVVAWLLELGQGSTYGEYWQGRYSMPFAVGFPLVAVWRDRDRDIDKLTPLIVVTSWIVVNLGFFAAQRRWAVGNDGTWYAWRWDRWDSPLPPILLLVVHVAATGLLARRIALGGPSTEAAR